MLVAIDFSMTSTAMAAIVNGERLLWSFVPELTASKKFDLHRAVAPHVKVVCYGGRVESSDYSEGEGQKLMAASRLAECIANEIAAVGGCTRAVFEGFSFGSKGSSFIDLIVYNTVCKKELLDRFGCAVSVMAPSTIKKRYTGSGRSRKPEMYLKFIAEDTPFSRMANAAIGPYAETMKVPKPVEDVVDAIAILETWDKA